MTLTRFEPYPHQLRMQETVDEGLQLGDSVLIAAPTGSGKTLVLAEVSRPYLARQEPVALLVHRQELVEQSHKTILRQTGYDAGIVWKDRKEWDRLITILAQDTLHGTEIPEGWWVRLLMIDESHHATAPTWQTSIERLRPTKLVGASATPFRQDREPLSPRPFQRVYRPVTPKELIELGILCPPIIESPVVHDDQGQPQAIGQANNLIALYKRTVEYAIAQNRQKIVLYVSTNGEDTPSRVIKATKDSLNQAGIPAYGVDQNMSASRRKTDLARFASNPGVAVLVNYMTVTEGTDLPCIDAVIIGRQTNSETTIIQMIGRGMRKYGTKRDCLVIEYTGRPDMDDIINYWRIDTAQNLKPDEDEENQKTRRLLKKELVRLAADFPDHVNQFARSKITYPWFQPYPNEPVWALPLWTNPDEAGRYITIEPMRNGSWKFTELRMPKRGPTPTRRRQKIFATAAEATQETRKMLGNRASMLARTATWRLKPASADQRRAWDRLTGGEQATPADLTAGEASDLIAQQRFINRVQKSLL